MKITIYRKKLVLMLVYLLFSQVGTAQFLVDMIDTTKNDQKRLWAVYTKRDHLQISGYFQPQFQYAQSKGVENYSGGDFSEFSNNRFMIRRGRIRFDYAHFTDAGLPQAQVVFQFDGSERGVVIRDFWARYYESRFQLFSFTAGMFARPFSYELNLSSSDRESPERGRMSQILMRTERDLGAMATLEPRKRSSKLRLLKLDVGVFNGQGLTGEEEYDSYKDFITRIALKPYDISKSVSVSGGLSLFEGGIAQNSNYIFKMSDANGGKVFSVDSSLDNIGRKAPRKYQGIDAQLRFKNSWGNTELRGEYWWGTQSAAANESNTPGTVLSEPYYIRNFRGAFVYLLQNFISDKHMLVLKYDIYDPNRDIDGRDVGNLLSNTHSGDIKYNTFGIGYLHLFGTHIKLTLWYDMIRNETTSLVGYTTDIRDNILTCRVQFRF